LFAGAEIVVVGDVVSGGSTVNEAAAGEASTFDAASRARAWTV
jgi:hypothetical protein